MTEYTEDDARSNPDGESADDAALRWMIRAKTEQQRALKAEEERDEAVERAEKHRRAEGDHRNNARGWMQTSEEWQATTEEGEKRALAAESRPLTPDAITDEMVERGARVLADWDGAGGWGTPQWGGEIPERAYIHAARQALTAALTEPPARPEGAERWEDFLIDSLDYQALTDQQITDLADRIAEEMNR